MNDIESLLVLIAEHGGIKERAAYERLLSERDRLRAERDDLGRSRADLKDIIVAWEATAEGIKSRADKAEAEINRLKHGLETEHLFWRHLGEPENGRTNLTAGEHDQ